MLHVALANAVGLVAAPRRRANRVRGMARQSAEKQPVRRKILEFHIKNRTQPAFQALRSRSVRIPQRGLDPSEHLITGALIKRKNKRLLGIKVIVGGPQ